jgi:hypothetical protein
MISHFEEDGGAEGDRTPDLRNAIATLSQLSYGPNPSRALGDVHRPSKEGNYIPRRDFLAFVVLAGRLDAEV